MAGLLDSLLADDTTKDDAGMTQADRRQPVWSGLIKAGLLGVAAGQPMWPEQRAKYLAGIGEAVGNIGEQQQALRTQGIQNVLRTQQIQSQRQQLQDTQKIRDYVNSPDFQTWVKTLPPELQATVMGSALKGDFSGIEKARESMMPKPAGQLIYDPRTKTFMNAAGRVVIGPDGKPATGSSGMFDPSQPNVGGTDRLNLSALQDVPHDLAIQALRVARGEVAPPTTRSNPDANEINRLAALVAGANGTSFQTRQKFENSLTGERGIVSTVSRATQHEGTAIDLYNSIGNMDGGAGQKYWNMARNKVNSIGNPDLVQKMTAARVAMVNAITEAKNAIAGAKGTGVVEREEIDKSIDPNMSIAEMKGLMQAVHSQMMEALTSVAYRGSQVRHGEVTPESLVGPEVWKHHQNIEKFYTSPSPKSAAPAASGYVHPNGTRVTPEEIAATAKARGITEAQVIEQLGLKPVQ